MVVVSFSSVICILGSCLFCLCFLLLSVFCGFFVLWGGGGGGGARACLYFRFNNGE